VTLHTADIDWYGWEPLGQRLTLGRHLTEEQRRCTIALALAHRALGHWGSSLEQDIEARELAAWWLVPTGALIEAGRAVGTSPWRIVDYLRVSRATLAVRLGLTCHHLTNWEVFHGYFCRHCV
jgi:hypothetical protein